MKVAGGLTELVVIEDAGHFVWEDAPARGGEAVTAFLAARL
jgi:pimeloyl-ACP methyl ester carboxylesterase